MDDIDALLYMPASFVCDECGFRLEKRTLIAQTGQVGIKKGGYEPDPCPNDGSAMRRVTWKEAYEDSSESSSELMEALIESVKLQSHYAGILNDYDGGKRLQFNCPAHWIQRLLETGTIRKR
jgi:hypothetical protein